MPPYRPYQTSLNAQPVQLLTDFDDYFQDVAETMKGLDAPTVFITCWILRRTTVLRESPKLTLLDLIVDVLKKNGSVYLLWNSQASVKLTPLSVLDEARKLRNEARKAAGNKWVDGRLKVVVDHVRHDHPERIAKMLSLAEAQTSVTTDEEKLLKLWLVDFPKQVPRERNVAAFSAQSLHQKSFVAIGTRAGAPSLTAYCGGMDFITSKNNENGKGWHDYALRVRDDRGAAVLANFAERWNAELARLAQIISIGVTATDTLDTATLWTATGDANASDITAHRTLPSAAAASRVKEVLSEYETMVGQAQTRIILLNQYIRHRQLMLKIEQRLAAVPALRFTLIMPSYAEEMPGGGLEMAKLRHEYVTAADAAARTALGPRVAAADVLVPPDQKLSLELQAQCLQNLVTHSRVKIWFPERVSRDGQGRISDYRARPYVHAKAMAIDDKALIVGSANLNPRSLDGVADVELDLAFRRAASTTLPDVPETLAATGWTAEPADEKDTAVYKAGNYYFERNLVRYTPLHLEFDRKLAKFPVGRPAIKQYFKAQFGADVDSALERVTLDFKIDFVLSQAAGLGIDVDNGDLGAQMLPLMHDFL